MQLPAFTEGQDLALAISDLVLVGGLGLTFASIRFRIGIWSAWHFAMPVYLAVSALLVGPLNRYTIGNKVVGLVVLLASYLFVTSNVWTWADIARVIRFFFLGVVIFSFVGIVKYALSFDLPFTYCQSCDVRLLAFMPDANLYGSLVVVAIAAFVALDGSRFAVVPRALRWPSVLVLVTALALSSSRSAWLALAGVVIVAIATKSGRGLGLLSVSVAALVAAAVVFATEAVLGFVQLAGRRHSIDSRLGLIDHGIEAFFENPLVGIGIGSSHDRFGQIVHNTFLWIGAELGVIGLVIFGGFFVWITARSARAYRGASSAHRPLVVFLIMGNVAMLVFSLSVEAFYQRQWWLLFALTASASVLIGHRATVPPFPSVAALRESDLVRRVIPGLIVLAILFLGVLVVFAGTNWMLDRSVSADPEVLAGQVAGGGGDNGRPPTTSPGGGGMPLAVATTTTIVFGPVSTTIPGVIGLPTLPPPTTLPPATTRPTSPSSTPAPSGPTVTQPPRPGTGPSSPTTTQPATTITTVSPPTSTATTSSSSTSTTAPTTVTTGSPPTSAPTTSSTSTTTTAPTTTTTSPPATTVTVPTTTTTIPPATTITVPPIPSLPTLPTLPTIPSRNQD